MHDAAEAYIGDLLGPYKKCEEFAWYRALESRWMLHIVRSLKLESFYPILARQESWPLGEDWWMTPEVHFVDQIMLCIEAECLMPPDAHWTERKKKLLADGIVFTSLNELSHKRYGDGAYWDSSVAASRFIDCFLRLTGRSFGEI